jgi:hypothetical protein
MSKRLEARELTSRERQIIEVLRLNGGNMPNEDIALETGLSRSSVNRCLGELHKLGHVEVYIWVLHGKVNESAELKSLPPGSDAASDPPGPVVVGDVEILSFLPGGFIYRGAAHTLGGKPLAVLEALSKARGRRLTLRQLQDRVWKDSDAGEEAVKSAIKKARRSLRQATGDASRDPLPAVDRGSGRTAWHLDLP